MPPPKLPFSAPPEALAALSGVLVVVAFPRYGAEWGIEHVIWFALVPFFLAARGRGFRRGAFYGFVMGVTLEAAGFLWILYAIRSFTAAGGLLSALMFLVWVLYSAVPWAALGGAVGCARTPAGLLATLFLWVGIEDWFPRLFPWHLGGALYDVNPLVQAADLAGASGLTAIVYAANLALYALVLGLRERRRPPWLALALCGALVGAAWLYGGWRYEAVRSQVESTPSFRVLLVQASLPPSVRHEDRRKALERYLELTEGALKVSPRPDFIVWPEGADGFPFVLTPGAEWAGHRMPEDARDLERRLRSLGVPIVFGGSALAKENERVLAYNAAIYLEEGASAPRIYLKNHRLLFGEVNPFVEILPDRLRDALGLRFVGTIAAGRENPPFPFGTLRFRNCICYEAVLPGYVRRSARGVNFLVNITEDYWYGRTAHVTQHLSVLRLRAIESRIAILRAANAGPSGVIDALGRFAGTEKSFETALVAREVRPYSEESPYRRGGAWASLVALVLGAGILGGAEGRRAMRRRKAER